VVIAVADGLGSAPRSDVGARIAVDAALAATLAALAASPSAPLSELAREAVGQARAAIEIKAAELACPLADVACTLIVVVFSGERVGVAHVGDGAVVCQTDVGLILASGPGDSEYTNEVVPLTATEWEAALRVTPELAGVRGVAAFSDGCQRAGLRRSAAGVEPFEKFFGPLFAYARELTDLEQGQAELAALLLSEKVCANSDDDKTLVLAVGLPGDPKDFGDAP
jgi:hypothetical protein